MKKDEFSIKNIDLNLDDDQLELDLSDAMIDSSAIFNSKFEWNVTPQSHVTIDTDQERIGITYKDGRETSVTFQDLEKMSVLIDTLDQIGDSSELGRLFRTNMAMHKLRGND